MESQSELTQQFESEISNAGILDEILAAYDKFISAWENANLDGDPAVEGVPIDGRVKERTINFYKDVKDTSKEIVGEGIPSVVRDAIISMVEGEE